MTLQNEVFSLHNCIKIAFDYLNASNEQYESEFFYVLLTVHIGTALGK